MRMPTVAFCSRYNANRTTGSNEPWCSTHPRSVPFHNAHGLARRCLSATSATRPCSVRRCSGTFRCTRESARCERLLCVPVLTCSHAKPCFEATHPVPAGGPRSRLLFCSLHLFRSSGGACCGRETHPRWRTVAENMAFQPRRKTMQTGLVAEQDLFCVCGSTGT